MRACTVEAGCWQRRLAALFLWLPRERVEIGGQHSIQWEDVLPVPEPLRRLVFQYFIRRKARVMTMQKLDCGHCGRGVMVEKFSPAHTSVQWLDDTRHCPRICTARRSLGDSNRTCDALRLTIEEAFQNKVILVSSLEFPNEISFRPR
jgi:hypothetical protein